MKLKKTNEQKLICLSALCEHECWDNTCLFNKLVDKDSQFYYEQLVKIIADEVKAAEDAIRIKYEKQIEKLEKDSEGVKSGAAKKKSIRA